MVNRAAQRKRIYVSRKIQGRMVGRLAMYWGVYHVVLWHAMFIFRFSEYRQGLLTGSTPVPFRELYGSFLEQHYSMILCALAVFPIILWDMVKTTHRVAGPLVRFQNVLRQLARGETVKEVKLRKGDLLVEFQDAFNEYLAALNATATPERTAEGDKRPSQQKATGPEELLLDDLQEIQATVGRFRSDDVDGSTTAQPPSESTGNISPSGQNDPSEP